MASRMAWYRSSAVNGLSITRTGASEDWIYGLAVRSLFNVKVFGLECAVHLVGAPGGLSLVNTSRFFAVYDSQSGGTSSSVKIAVTGHSGTQAPQSMHSSGWM
jgi:uncharacterized YccA/Bax inhibitor family protein